jgi:hypothetical protein
MKNLSMRNNLIGSDYDLIHICLVKEKLSSLIIKEKYSIGTELVLITLRNGVKERKKFSNEENDPISFKELNEELYEIKISCMVV